MDERKLPELDKRHRKYKGGERERGIKGYIRMRLKKSLDVGLNCIYLEFGCI